MSEIEENRTASLSIRIWPRLKAEIDRIAKDDGRTTAQYVERLLIAHLQENGRWPK
jgi:predicted DNA-binding protein